MWCAPDLDIDIKILSVIFKKKRSRVVLLSTATFDHTWQWKKSKYTTLQTQCVFVCIISRVRKIYTHSLSHSETTSVWLILNNLFLSLLWLNKTKKTTTVVTKFIYVHCLFSKNRKAVVVFLHYNLIFFNRFRCLSVGKYSL